MRYDQIQTLYMETVNWNWECDRDTLKLAYINKVMGEVEGGMEVEINIISEYVQLGMV